MLFCCVKNDAPKTYPVTKKTSSPLPPIPPVPPPSPMYPHPPSLHPLLQPILIFLRLFLLLLVVSVTLLSLSLSLSSPFTSLPYPGTRMIKREIN